MVPRQTKVTQAPSGLEVVSASLWVIYCGKTISTITGLAILSALITFFFIRPLTTDGMALEDAEVRIKFGFSRILD